MTTGVAVTGMSVLSGLADGLDGFTGLLRTGAPCAANDLAGFTTRAWARRHLDAGTAAALAEAAGRAALPARTAACVALAATRMAGWRPEELHDAAVLVAGTNLAQGYQADAQARFAQTGRARAAHIVDHLDTDAIGTVSQVLGLHGEGCVVGGASASGALAVIQGVRLLAMGEVDRCLVVAPAAEPSPLEIAAFTTSGAMAEGPDARCRPFDTARTGFVFGQAAAAVTLERTDGPRALAHVLGYGQALDAHRGAEPDPAGQARAMRAALDRAELDPDEIDLVNAHATGSHRGDLAEAASLAEVFADAKPVVNATKALTGHPLGAAGLLELVAVVTQLREGFVHGNPLLAKPVDAPLNHAGPAAAPAGYRTALSNSFAFSGINASLVLHTPETRK
ncbi:malonyl-ACP decarboxylase [Crossiella equi]|uniref:Malonyl-ACP decarboxylase n=1 Tax=Crossiella equi TaxID=130796 RepID=A0ABS5ASB7_9PSEU|nr:beta-ketoacyl synthase N-terminal-like domain-containing protein [Crossiella equi]MBP2479460.1 malonyl-ACP decarboxylase [Crossiella equi]